jgi:hypothetical protein
MKRYYYTSYSSSSIESVIVTVLCLSPFSSVLRGELVPSVPPKSRSSTVCLVWLGLVAVHDKMAGLQDSDVRNRLTTVTMVLNQKKKKFFSSFKRS